MSVFKSCKFTFKTPRSSIPVQKNTMLHDLFMEEIETRAVKTTIDKIAIRGKTAVDRSVTIAATFFQRVCARTPLDEDYVSGYDEDGMPIWHKADKIQCRMDWYAECNGKTLTASQVCDEFPDAFDTYNDEEKIQLIKEMMLNKFTDLKYGDVNITFGNNNPYFAVLEYGGNIHPYDEKETDIKQGPLYEHGVENSHSVQAPVGMLRITQMELEELLANYSNPKTYGKNLTRGYTTNATEKNLNKEDLKKLMNKFKRLHTFSLKDIKEYLK